MRTIVTLLVMSFSLFLNAQSRMVALGGHKFEIVSEQNPDCWGGTWSTERLYHVTEAGKICLELPNKWRNSILFIGEMTLSENNGTQMLHLNFINQFGPQTMEFLFHQGEWVTLSRPRSQEKQRGGYDIQ